MDLKGLLPGTCVLVIDHIGNRVHLHAQRMKTSDSDKYAMQTGRLEDIIKVVNLRLKVRSHCHCV